MLITAKEEID